MTKRLYMVNAGSNVAGTAVAPGSVSVVNSETNAVIANVDLAAGGLPSANPAVNEQTNKIYVANGGGFGAQWSVNVIDGTTNTATVVNTSAFPNASVIDQMVANPISNRIYFRISQGISASAGVIDGATDVATALPVVSGTVFHVLFNRTLNRVYFFTTTGVHVLDGTNDFEITNIPLPIVPSNVVLSETTGRIYATSTTQKVLMAIDGNTNTSLGVFPLAKTPGALAINPASNRLYIGANGPPNGVDWTVSFLDAGSLAVKRVLRVPLRPVRLVVNPATNVLYASTASSGRTGVMVISDRGSAPYDFDGDGRTDISVYRPGSTGTWYVQRSTAGFYGLEFGGGSDKITPADYDGDGKMDIAVYRPAEGMWYRFLSTTETFTASPFGLPSDIPTPLDYDGDGRADIAIFKPSDGNWWIERSSLGTIATQFGQDGDVPVVGDYDGDGTSDIGIFRPANGLWFIRRSSAGDIGYQFGFGTDKVTPADYDGDGKTDIAVYRPSTGQWFIANSGSATYPIHQFGAPTDIPVPGDYDGDGRADVAIFRPSTGQWWLQRTTAGLTVVPFGQDGDRPTPNAFGN